MLSCFTEAATGSLPLWAMTADAFPGWRERQSEAVGAWLEGSGFEAKPGACALVPAAAGGPAGAVVVLSAKPAPWEMAAAYGRLPAGDYHLAPEGELDPEPMLLGWALASYRFERYRKREHKARRLVIAGLEAGRATILAEAIYRARDLINTPAADLGPAELAAAVHEVATIHGATCGVIEGDALISANYPAIFAVGKASPRAPRMIDLIWGDPNAPKVTLIGKGVCFDTGGLDLKTAAGMLLMKKDMGGAAVTLALAQAIMAAKLPVCLRLLIGAVENSVAGNAFRPGDVLSTRKGLTIEVGNTDAEGRIVLCDLLAEADTEQPDLMIDCATLTGAARVALGTDLPAMYCNDDAMADALLEAGTTIHDPLWRMPLYQGYRELIDSPIADINNAGTGGMGGSITAALFLESFVEQAKAWVHLDIYGWNPKDRPGRPKGGEATALRALFAAIERRYGKA